MQKKNPQNPPSFKLKNKKEPKTLKGIWANKGFEKIVDLEDAIRKMRIELGNQIYNRKL